jgi:hypothetical protein
MGDCSRIQRGSGFHQRQGSAYVVVFIAIVFLPETKGKTLQAFD